jgi:type IV pilus assembly protein PilM
MAEELGRGLADAERLKLEAIRAAAGGGAAPAPEVARAFDNARQSFATRLSLEITRSVANYRRQSGVEAPGRVLLTGSGAQMPELGALLAEKLKTPVEGYEPLRGVPFGTGAVEGDFKAGAHVIGEAVGAALRLNQRGLARFNFLPARVVSTRAFRRRQPYLVSAAALVAASLAIPILVYSVMADAYQEKIETLKVQALPLQSYSNRIRQAREDAETVRHQIAGIKGLVETKSNWISFFRDLQERLVKIENVWLDGLQVLRPESAVQTSALAGTLFGDLAKQNSAANAQTQSLRLHLTGRLLDKNNPLSKVSFESQQRVKTLLASFTESQFIVRLEKERFDNSVAGVLKFDFILVVNPERSL